MYCLWALPQGDADFPVAGDQDQVREYLPVWEPRSPVMTIRRERSIWQQQYWAHRSATTATYIPITVWRPGARQISPLCVRTDDGLS